MLAVVAMSYEEEAEVMNAVRYNNQIRYFIILYKYIGKCFLIILLDPYVHFFRYKIF